MLNDIGTCCWDYKMKRYKFRLLHSIDSIVDIDEMVIDDFEHLEGEWVKHEDVEKEINEAYKTGYFTDQNSKALGFTLKRIACNCFHMSELKETFWICPEHGYKKL